MAHIEHNECHTITTAKFHTYRAQKEIVRAFLADPEGFEAKRRSESGSIAGYISNQPSELGSKQENVPLVEPSLLDDPISESGGGVPIAPVRSKDAYPKLNSVAYREGPGEDLLTGATSPGMNEPGVVWGTNSSVLLFPNVVRTPVSPTISVTEAVKPEEEAEKGNPWDPTSKSFRPNDFLHPITRKFCCPHPQCS